MANKKTIKKQSKMGDGKFHFGNNLGTRLIILFGAIVLFCILWTIHSYASLHSNNSVSPFKTAAPSYKATYIDNAKDTKTYNGVKFSNDLFDVKLVMTEYDDNMKAECETSKAKNPDVAKFKLQITAKDTSKLGTIDDSNYVSAMLCMYSDWTGDIAYSSEVKFNYNYITNKTDSYRKDLTVTSKISYPANPIAFVTIEEPSFKLALTYADDKEKLHTIFLNYTYKNTRNTSTKGGIQK